MGDLDDFFAKKDKKKKGTKGFSKANTDILAKNLEEMERKEQSKQDRQESYLPEGSLPTQAMTELLQQSVLYLLEGIDYPMYPARP